MVATKHSKVFGVGLSKTGTTSLNSALQLLGYESIHDPEELVFADGDALACRREFAEDYDALTDIEAALFFRELDQFFPGAKFIYTTRERESWLRSCENHFNQHLRNTPMARSLLRAVYATETFDREKFIRAYEAHERAVFEHFRGREADLLVLDVAEPQKWLKICTFLGEPLPGESYPRENVATPVPMGLKKFLRRFGLLTELWRLSRARYGDVSRRLRSRSAVSY